MIAAAGLADYKVVLWPCTYELEARSADHAVQRAREMAPAGTRVDDVRAVYARDERGEWRLVPRPAKGW